MYNLIYVFIFIFNSFFTITPLVVSFYSLFYNNLFEINLLTYIGLTIGWIGRFITASGAYKLHKSNLKFLVSDSIFKWSRNPISLGLFVTFFGLLLVLPHLLLITGYVVFVININYKIGIEEVFLLNKFGRNYHNYISSTPKYLIK